MARQPICKAPVRKRAISKQTTRRPLGRPCARRSDRKGAFVVGVIIVMLVVATLVAAFTRSLVAQSRNARIHANYRQASWLAESGLSRGAARMARNSEYAGETWSLNGEQIRGGAEVEIKAMAATEDNFRILRVKARYPLKSRTPATVEATIQIKTSATGDEL